MDINNKICYEDLLNNRLSFNEYINNVRTKSHNKAYSMALDSLLKHLYTESGSRAMYDVWLDKFYKTHKLIEIKNTDYTKPSSVRISNYTYPYDKYTYDLTEYWTNVFNENKSSLSDKSIDEDTLLYAEIISFDYINGICKLKNKLNGFEFTVPFKYINNDTPVSDTLSINDLFGEKIYNKNLGY